MAVALAMVALEDRLRSIVREELTRAAAAPGEPDGDDAMWNADRVAKALGRSPEAVRRAHERGTLGVEAIRVGKRALRWRARDVRALATRGRARSGAKLGS